MGLLELVEVYPCVAKSQVGEITFLRRFNVFLVKDFCNLSHFSFPESDYGKDTRRIFRRVSLPTEAVIWPTWLLMDANALEPVHQAVSVSRASAMAALSAFTSRQTPSFSEGLSLGVKERSP